MEEDVVRALFPAMVERRRHLHRHPELSYQEKETSGFAAEKLRELGVETIVNVGGFGVVGKIRGGLPGKTVALRADMDALPIQDEKAANTPPRCPASCTPAATTGIRRRCLRSRNISAGFARSCAGKSACCSSRRRRPAPAERRR